MLHIPGRCVRVDMRQPQQPAHPRRRGALAAPADADAPAGDEHAVAAAAATAGAAAAAAAGGAWAKEPTGAEESAPPPPPLVRSGHAASPTPY